MIQEIPLFDGPLDGASVQIHRCAISNKVTKVASSFGTIVAVKRVEVDERPCMLFCVQREKGLKKFAFYSFRKMWMAWVPDPRKVDPGVEYDDIM